MDRGTLIVGIVLGLIAIMPFVLTAHNRKKARNSLLGILSKSARKNNSKLTKYDYVGDSIIGIDEYKHLVYMGNNEDNIKVVNLKQVESATIERIKSTVKFNGSTTEKLERLYMRFNPNSTIKKVIELDFFNIDHSLLPDGEIEAIEKWNTIVRMQLKLIKA